MIVQSKINPRLWVMVRNTGPAGIIDFNRMCITVDKQVILDKQTRFEIVLHLFTALIIIGLFINIVL